jgi:hypothetical protein
LDKYKPLTEAERLEAYFWQLQSMMPNPPKDWAKTAKPCKWAKILEERKQNNGGQKET